MIVTIFILGVSVGKNPINDKIIENFIDKQKVVKKH